MANRSILAGVFFACAVAAVAQGPSPNLYKIELATTGGAMVSLNQPTLVNGNYVFYAWPDGGKTAVRQAMVKRITLLTGAAAETVYRIDLVPSGTVFAKDKPTLKGGAYIFHAWRGGALGSLRASDVQSITRLTGDDAFWAEQRLTGEVSIGGPLSMQGGGKVVVIGAPERPSAQAGPQNVSGISGAPTYGNWQYQGTPGTSDAYGPANATMSNGVPTMPAATDGGAPPTQPNP